MPDSNDKDYPEQKKLLCPGYYSMNEAEIGLMLTTHWLKIGQEMLTGNGSYARGGGKDNADDFIDLTCNSGVGFTTGTSPKREHATGILAYYPLDQHAR